MNTPILSVHYAPGVLVVLKWVSPDYLVPTTDSHRIKMSPVRANNQQVIAGLHLLQGDEQSWCLERSWVRK